MKFIHNRDKSGVSIFSAEYQLILKITGNPLLFCQQHNGFLVGFGKEVLRIEIDTHKNSHSSLDVFYNQKHILSFVAETPERPACLSIYDELPTLLSVSKLSDIQKNGWILMDYRDSSKQGVFPPEIQVRKSRIKISEGNNKKARFREL